MKRIAMLVVSLLALAGLVVGGAYLWVWKTQDDWVVQAIARLNERVERSIPAARKAAEEVKGLPIMRQQRPEGDAAEVLNAIVRWSVRTPDGKRKTEPAGGVATVYPRESGLDDAVARFPLTVDERASFADRLSRLDFAWLSGLRRFGRWTMRPLPVDDEDLHQTATLRRDLQRVARLRLLQGLATNDAQAAVDEVEHLAWLMMTTERQWTLTLV